MEIGRSTSPPDPERLKGDIKRLNIVGYGSLGIAALPLIVDVIRNYLGGHVSLDELKLHTLIGFFSLGTGAVLLHIRDLLQKQLPPETLK